MSLFLLVVILFIGLAFVVISIKKFYPYNMIETNIQGASIVKSEDKDVIYWLFNTADLWANSGIEVQKGDILTIRASGSSFTAIHHLVDASKQNYVPQDKWVGTEGHSKDNPRDLLRAQYRLCKDAAEEILLMKIIDPSYAQKPIREWDEKTLTQDIEVIGKERTLYISKPGVLHFAVNDIVLTDSNLKDMYRDYLISIDCLSGGLAKERGKIISNFDSICEDKKTKNYDYINLIKKYNEDLKINPSEAKEIGLSPGKYPVNKNNDSTYYKSYPLVNELVYYKQKKFIDAWYVDNLGSFLIVIERKRN